VPVPFPFARLNALQPAVNILTVYHTHVFAKLHKQNKKMTAFKNIFWKAMISKGLNAMPALSKFLVLLALVLSTSHSNAFTSLSLVARNQVWVNHLT
jgi:hypothetical protein